METMAAHGWGTTGPLSEALFEAGYRFRFYQAVRLLEILHPDRQPVGEGSIPDRETVRFTAPASMAFPAGDVHEVARRPGDGPPATMAVHVMGLAGAFGPLPAPYSELIAERRRNRDEALAAFLDVFNHRLVSLLYRVRKVARVGFEWTSPERTFAARALFALMGLGTEGLRERTPVPDRSLLACAALFAPPPRSMSGLETLLGHHFQVPVQGRAFRGRWLAVSEDQRTRLGENGANRRLGRSVLLGGRVWDQAGKFEIVLGPLAAERLRAFLPGRRAFTVLCELTRFYAGNELEFDLRLVVAGDDAPLAALGAGDGPRLGWTSWLGRPGGGAPGGYQSVRLSASAMAESDGGRA